MNHLLVKDQYALSTMDHSSEHIIQNELIRMHKALLQGYSSEYAVLAAPDDHENSKRIQEVVNKIRLLNPSLFFLIGIGGSHLGPAAVIQAVLGTYYNELSNNKLKFYAVDTLDEYQMNNQTALLEQTLASGKTVVLNIVTKSGNTTETLVNAAIMVDILKKYHPQDYAKYIVVTTDDNSHLCALSLENSYTVLPIAQLIGGRYSVLTAVGLFPLSMLGIDIASFVQGAKEMRDSCLEQNKANPAVRSALAIYQHYSSGKNIHDTFLYSPTLALLGAWYRQLVGESLGKMDNRAGEHIFTGITPTVSIGTNDLHSVAQLYLGGPYDKFTTFVYANWQNGRVINDANFLKSIEYVVGKTLSAVRNTIIEGVSLAYQEHKRPFIEIVLPEITPYYLGQFMMLKMIEVMLLGKLMDVNPFDQPAVELYKSNTRRLLQ